MRGPPFQVSPLAQGEYNLNYLLSLPAPGWSCA